LGKSIVIQLFEAVVIMAQMCGLLRWLAAVGCFVVLVAPVCSCLETAVAPTLPTLAQTTLIH
jgi:hypothetical protein